MDASPDIFSSRDQTRTSPVLYRERQSKIRAFYDACSVANILRGVLDTRVNRIRVEGQIRFEYGYAWTWKCLKLERKFAGFG